MAERTSTKVGTGTVRARSGGTRIGDREAPPERPRPPVAQRSALLLRRINELVREAVGARPPLIHFFCECQRDDCYEPVWLTADAYDERRTGSRPLILPGYDLERPERKRQ